MVEYIRNLVSMHRERNDRGASAVEYGLLIAGIAVVVAAGILLLGPKINDKFNDTCKAVNGNTACTTSSGTGSG